jgi:hypothetical protein
MLSFEVAELTGDGVKDKEDDGEVPEALLFRLRVLLESIEESWPSDAANATGPDPAPAAPRLGGGAMGRSDERELGGVGSWSFEDVLQSEVEKGEGAPGEEGLSSSSELQYLSRISSK